MHSDDAATVTAGAITFVVEHRTVVQDGVETGGPTVRVLGGDDGHEYLRLDLFHASPHYHYEPPGEPERVLMLDTAAEGDAIDWGMTRLRERLVPMLGAAGGERLADTLEPTTLAHAIDDVESLVRTGAQPSTA